MPLELYPEQERRVGRTMRRGTERGLSLAAGIIGLIFIIRPGLFDNPLYYLMGLLAPPAVWGILFLLIGAGRGLFLFINGHYPQGPYVRYWLSLLSFFCIWLPLSAVYIWYDLSVIMGHKGYVLLGGVSLPYMAWTELLSLLALQAWIEAQHCKG